MKIFKFIILAILLSFFSQNITAQNTSSEKEEAIKNEFSVNQLKKFNNASNIISAGNIFMQEIKALEQDIFNEKEIIRESSSKSERKASTKKLKELEKKVHTKLVKATEESEKGWEDLYKVYKSKIDALIKGCSNKGRNKIASKYSYDAKTKFTDAKNILKKLTDRDDYEHLSKQINLSSQLKREGIVFQIEAICLYVDCTSEPVNEDIVEIPDNIKGNENATGDSDDGSSKIKAEANHANIYFTVQILAVSKRLPSIKVDNIYNGNRGVAKILHDGLWKYLVGHFNDYNDAKLFQEGIGRDSFIVAFKDEKRVEDITTIVDINGNLK